MKTQLFSRVKTHWKAYKTKLRADCKFTWKPFLFAFVLTEIVFFVIKFYGINMSEKLHYMLTMTLLGIVPAVWIMIKNEKNNNRSNKEIFLKAIIVFFYTLLLYYYLEQWFSYFS